MRTDVHLALCQLSVVLKCLTVFRGTVTANRYSFYRPQNTICPTKAYLYTHGFNLTPWQWDRYLCNQRKGQHDGNIKWLQQRPPLF